MSEVIFKYPNQENFNYYYIPDECFIISDRNTTVNYCEEHEVIQKIQKNEEGFFDFSKNMIDIGADDGNYSMLLDFKHNYCFEPNRRSSCILHANMYLKDKVYNTDVYNVLLSSIEKDVIYDGFSCDENTTNENCYNFHKVYEQQHTVRSKTLDSYNFKNVGFIKIDVEGYEEEVLRGGLLTIIQNNYPPILFECWDVGKSTMTHEKHDSLFNLLETLGYKIFEYWGDFETHLAVHKTQLEKNNQ